MIYLWEGCYLCHMVAMLHRDLAVRLLLWQNKRALCPAGNLALAHGYALVGLFTEVGLRRHLAWVGAFVFIK